jgi:hypothetical protein
MPPHAASPDAPVEKRESRESRGWWAQVGKKREEREEKERLTVGLFCMQSMRWRPRSPPCAQEVCRVRRIKIACVGMEISYREAD